MLRMPIRARRNLVAGLCCLCLLCPVIASAQSVENRRILDILLSSSANSYRIEVRLDALPPYRIIRPRGSEPLQMILNQTDADASLQPQPSSNDLITAVWINPGNSGIATIEFPLATGNVEISDWTVLSPDPAIIISLTPRAGAMTAAAPAAAQTPTPADIGRIALPETGVSESAGEDTVVLPEDETLESEIPLDQWLGEDAPTTYSAVVEPIQTTPGHIAPIFSLSSVDLQFPSAGQMLQAFEDRRYLQSLQIGLDALLLEQPRESLASLLHFLAECRYHLAMDRAQRITGEDPDWQTALNYCRQARRFAPNHPLGPAIDYRMSRIYGEMEFRPEQQAVLMHLLRENRLPNLDLLLWESGYVALHRFNSMAAAGNSDTRAARDQLSRASEAFRLYTQRFPYGRHYPDALFRLGDCYYHSGDYVRAYDAMHAATVAAQRMSEASLFITTPDLYSHFALAAHRLGKTNLLNPETDSNAREFVRILRMAQNPQVRLEFARLLDAGGKRDEAIREYATLINLADGDPFNPAVREARIAITRYALTDALAGRTDQAIPHQDYRDPVASLRELHDTTYSLSERRALLAEKVQHLLAQNRQTEAANLIVASLMVDPPGQDEDPNSVPLRLSRTLWDILPDVLQRTPDRAHNTDSILLFEAFRRFLQDHPNQAEIEIQTAEQYLEAEFHQNAAQILRNLVISPNLTPEQRSRSEQLLLEATLDPDVWDIFQRDARRLTTPSNPPRMRARVLRRLGQAYSEQNRYNNAAQIFLEGAALGDDLPWEERLEFYNLAGKAYQDASVFSKVVEVYWKAIRELEASDQDLADHSEKITAFLFNMGVNFQQMGDAENAARAFEQCLRINPDVAPPAARYFLAEAFEQKGNINRAIETYNELATASESDPFWSQVALKRADQLRWEQDHPYLLKGSTP